MMCQFLVQARPRSSDILLALQRGDTGKFPVVIILIVLYNNVDWNNYTENLVTLYMYDRHLTETPRIQSPKNASCPSDFVVESKVSDIIEEWAFWGLAWEAAVNQPMIFCQDSSISQTSAWHATFRCPMFYHVTVHSTIKLKIHQY